MSNSNDFDMKNYFISGFVYTLNDMNKNRLLHTYFGFSLYLERRVVGSFITITSAISPNFEKCSFSPSGNNKKGKLNEKTRLLLANMKNEMNDENIEEMIENVNYVKLTRKLVKKFKSFQSKIEQQELKMSALKQQNIVAQKTTEVTNTHI